MNTFRSFLRVLIVAGSAAVCLPVHATTSMSPPESPPDKAPRNFPVTVRAGAENGREFLRNMTENEGRLFYEQWDKTPLRNDTAGPSGPPAIICGSVLNSTDVTANGMYSMQTDVGGITTIKEDPKLFAWVAGTMLGDGRYLLFGEGSSKTTFTHYTIYDSRTWEILEDNEKGNKNLYAKCIAYNPADGLVYGCFMNEKTSSYWDFACFDPATMQRRTISALKSNYWACIGCNAQGEIYSIDKAGVVYRVDRTDGTLTKLGACGVKPHGTFNASCFDFKTNTYYYLPASGVWGTNIYTIDLQTGTALKGREIPGKTLFMGAYVGEAAAEDNAPNVITDLSVTFVRDSLQGNVSFRLPEKNYNGEPSTSLLGYTVTRNGEVVKQVDPTPDIKWGQEVSLDMSVPELGRYTYEIRAMTGRATGPKAMKSLWIGNDYPSKVKNVVLEYSQEDGAFNLKWTAPTSSQHNGYVNFDSLTYNVYDAAGVKVREGVRQTSCSFPDANPDANAKRMYTVTAVNAGLESNSVNSNSLGFNQPPMYEPWDVASRFEEWTVLNVNGDYITWEFPYSYAEKGYVSISSNSSRTPIQVDDWLVSPPLRLEAGKEYDVYMGATSYRNRPASLEINGGKDLKPAALNIPILPKFTLASADSTSFRGTFTVDTTGVYYIGIHSTDSLYGRVEILDFKIEEGNAPKAPGMGAFEIVPAADFSLNAELRYTTPTRAVDGSPLQGPCNVEFFCEERSVGIVENVAPGAVATLKVTVPSVGERIWRVKPSNSAGTGKNIYRSKYVGVYRAMPPKNVRITEIDHTGNVIISWDPPTHDVMGNEIPASLVRYHIFEKGSAPVSVNVSETQTTLYAQVNYQQFVYFTVVSVTDAGYDKSQGVATSTLAVGPPYTVPFMESAPAKMVQHNWWLSGARSRWQVGASANPPDCTPQDNDGGMFAWAANGQHDVSTLHSGKIHVTGDNPTLSFYYRAVSTCNDSLTVKVMPIGADSYTTLGSITLRSSGKDDWVKAFFPLSAYAGKYVQIAFEGYSENADYVMCLDNIVIDKGNADNVAISKFIAPSRVNAANAYTATVTVENKGENPASGVKVTLSRDGEPMCQSSMFDLAVGESRDIVISDTTVNILTPDLVLYQATADYAADMNPDDNESDVKTVTVEKSNAPAPTDLKAETTGANDVRLTWNPSTATVNPDDYFTEDFEDFTSWETQNVGDWRLVDRDNAISAYSGTMYPNALTPYAFIVFDTEYPGFSHSDYKPYSGKKYMASFICYTRLSDDWLISPRLSGVAQDVSLMVKSFTLDYGNEEFRFYYSTTDNNPDSFTELAYVNDVPDKWTKYTYHLPEGARYFAIRSVSNDHLAMFVDDVRYNRGGGPLTLKGYNLYRDGVRVNSEPLTAAAYTDANLPAGTHRWHVTTVYDVAESRPSNEVSATTSVENTMGESATVTVEGHDIVISGAGGMPVKVCDAAGTLLLGVRGSGHDVAHTSGSGVYIVRIADRTIKVIVR